MLMHEKTCVIPIFDDPCIQIIPFIFVSMCYEPHRKCLHKTLPDIFYKCKDVKMYFLFLSFNMKAFLVILIEKLMKAK